MYRLPVLTRLRRHHPIVIKHGRTESSPTSAEVLPESPFLDADGVVQWDSLTQRPTVATVRRYGGPPAHPAALQASAGHYLKIIEDLLDGTPHKSTDLERGEQMLDLASRCQILAEGVAEPLALQIIQMNWLGFSISSSKLPQACLALYRLLLCWGLPEHAAIAILEPGIAYLDEVIDEQSEASISVPRWVQASKDGGYDGNDIVATRRHLQSVTAGLDCLLLVSANLLQYDMFHDPALSLDFLRRARRWSRLVREALMEADLTIRWPSHEKLSKYLDRLECWAVSAPAKPSTGFFGIPVSGRLPAIRLNERLSNLYTGPISPFFRGDRFSFEAFLQASQRPIEVFLADDHELLQAVMASGGSKADFHALAESYYDQLDTLKAKGPEEQPWNESRSVLFLRALSCRALAVVFQKSWASAQDLHSLLTTYAESEEQDTGVSTATALLVFAPLASVIDEALRVTVDGETVQLRAWIESFRSGINRALLSRVRLFTVGQPKKEHYPRLAQQIRIGFAREHQVDARLLPPLDGDDLDQIRKHCRSVREVRQATEWMLSQKIVAEQGGAVVN